VLAKTCPREQSLPNSARREQSLLRTRPREESLNTDSCPSLATLHGGASAATTVHVARNSVTTVHGDKFSLAPVQPGASDVLTRRTIHLNIFKEPLLTRGESSRDTGWLSFLQLGVYFMLQEDFTKSLKAAKSPTAIFDTRAHFNLEQNA